MWEMMFHIYYETLRHKNDEYIENIGQTFASCLLNPADFVTNLSDAPQCLLLGIDPARRSLRSSLLHHCRFAPVM